MYIATKRDKDTEKNTAYHTIKIRKPCNMITHDNADKLSSNVLKLTPSACLLCILPAGGGVHIYPLTKLVQAIVIASLASIKH